MDRVRFRPRVEECEPRLVPSNGDWHAIVQSGKVAARAAKQDPATVAALEDPFCSGQDPGPCAAPDVIRLRANLYALENDIYQRFRYWDQEAYNAQQDLNRLVANGAPLEQWWPVQMEVNYDLARRGSADWDDGDLTVDRIPDNQLQAWADGVWRGWRDRAANDARGEKNTERALNQAKHARPPNTQQITEKTWTLWVQRGSFDQEVTDIDLFNYYVDLP